MRQAEQPIYGDGGGDGSVGGAPVAGRAAGAGGVFSAVDAGRCLGMPDPDASARASRGDCDATPSPTLAHVLSRLVSIRSAVADLRDEPLWTLGQRDLLTLTREVESTLRGAFGVQIRLAGELHDRGLADMLNARSAAHLLHECLNITMSDARARVAAAAACLPTETPTGAAVDPAAPDLLAAIDDGRISAGQAGVITRCLAQIPDAVDADTRRLCLDTLLTEAAGRDENGLRQVADQIGQIVDPDGSLPGKTAEQRAELHIGVKRGDGLTPIRGALSPLTAEQLRVAIEALAGPSPVDANTPDLRPAGLRREQALGEILHRHLAGGAGPRDGGVRPQVVVTINLGDLIDALHRHQNPGHHSTDTATDGGTVGGVHPAGPSSAGPSAPAAGGDGAHLFGTGPFVGWALPDGFTPPQPWAQPGPDTGSGHATARAGRARSGGHAWSDYDGVQSADLAALLACDAVIIPQIVGTDSVVLDQGRGMRLFTAAQRRAITTRDKGCAFPACDIPAAWCEAHHIIWWSNGGVTAITNGVLLCRRHHVLIHQGHWRIEQDTGGGRPWFIPPTHIDPMRKPRRNTHFHLPDLLTTIQRQ